MVNLLMIKYLKGFIDKFPEELIGTPTTPVVDRLFQIRGEEEVVFFDKNRAKMFHHSV